MKKENCYFTMLWNIIQSFVFFPKKKMYIMEKKKTLQKNIKWRWKTSCFNTLELSLRINLHCLIIIIVHSYNLWINTKLSFKRIPKELFFHSFDYLYQCKHMEEIQFSYIFLHCFCRIFSTKICCLNFYQNF